MKSVKIILFLLLAFSESFAQYKEVNTLFIGSSTREKSNNGKGIYSITFSNTGKFGKIQLAAETTNPTFLAKTANNQFLIAANTAKQGFVESYKINGAEVSIINKTPTDAGPCYLTIKNNDVLTANYGGGSVSLLHVSETGVLSKVIDTKNHTISTASTHRRQKRAFAHSCYFEPNSNNIIAADLGANKIVFYQLKNNKLIPNTFSELEMLPNSGPRHIAIHPKLPFLYVLNELSATIAIVKKNTNKNIYKLQKTIETLPRDFIGKNTAAHIVITNDHRFLYMSNRGHNSIGVFKIKKDGDLKFVQRVSVHGKHPRNFSLSTNNEFLVVANKDSDNLCSFKRNAKTGKLTFLNEAFAPSPTFVLF